jgi:hypothetical protein
MATNGINVLIRLVEVTRDAVGAQARLSQEITELSRAAWTNQEDRRPMSKAYLESVRRESERYWQGFSELSFTYAEDLIQLGSDIGSAVVDDLRSAMRPAPVRRDSRSGSESTRVPAEVTMSGALGSTAFALVTVANRHPRARRITVTPSAVVDSKGEFVDAQIEADPATVTVPPGQQADVALSVVLSDLALQAGQDYSATIEVAGGEEATVPLLIHVNSD